MRVPPPGLLLFCLGVCFWPLALSAQNAAVAQMPTAQLQGQADLLLNGQKYGEAIPYVEELIKRLKESHDPVTQAQIERMQYSLAYAYLATEQNDEARKNFDDYLQAWRDKNIQRTTMAMDLLANLEFSLGRYEPASVLFKAMIESRHTPVDRSRLARMRLAECYLRLKAWDKAIAYLQEMVKDGSDPNVQGQAAVYLCQAYVENGQAEKIFEIVPLLESSNSVARYSVDFNLAMLTGGDNLLNSDRGDLALPLYLIVAPRRLIEEWLQKRREELDAGLEQVRKTPGPNTPARIALLNEQIKTLDQQAAQLEKTASYDEELRTRIAQAYFKQGRSWEALWIYESLVEDFPDSPLAADACYAGFALAGSLGQYERAADFGEQYRDKFPDGKYFEEVSYQLAQVYLQLHQFNQVVDLSKSVLDGKADTVFGDKLLFLSGYSLFMAEQFDRAAELFLEVRKRFPQSESVEAADYWYAMTFLFQGDYEHAMEQFKLVTERFPQGSYGVDSVFRAAVCLYGLEKYDEARRQLEDFVARHPESPQVAEAHILLGDIAGADGRLDDALKLYARVETLTPNQGQIDHAAMQAGKIYEAQEDWKGMDIFFTRYLTTYGTKGLYAEAIYRIGLAKKNQGDLKAMVDRYHNAIVTYGNDRSAIGIDLILRDWPGEYESLNRQPPTDMIKAAREKAEKGGQKALALRWAMALDAGPVDAAMLPDASPAVLEWIGRCAPDPALARDAYEKILSDFPDTEWNEPALLALARADAKEGDTKQARARYEKLRELFPTSESAGLALEEEADLLMAEQKYADAVKLLELILEVKEWRGEPWARALFKIGQAKLALGEPAEAFAYFQRVYVLYGHYKEWVARSYLESAKCLEKLGKDEDRQRTLREFLARKDCADLPQYAQAEQMVTP